jgi:hypothetical protein
MLAHGRTPYIHVALRRKGPSFSTLLEGHRTDKRCFRGRGTTLKGVATMRSGAASDASRRGNHAQRRGDRSFNVVATVLMWVAKAVWFCG